MEGIKWRRGIKFRVRTEDHDAAPTSDTRTLEAAAAQQVLQKKRFPRAQWTSIPKHEGNWGKGMKVVDRFTSCEEQLLDTTTGGAWVEAEIGRTLRLKAKKEGERRLKANDELAMRSIVEEVSARQRVISVSSTGVLLRCVLEEKRYVHPRLEWVEYLRLFFQERWFCPESSCFRFAMLVSSFSDGEKYERFFRASGPYAKRRLRR